MMPFLHLLAESDIPVQIIREKGFSDYIVYTLVGLYLVREVRAWFIPSKREISGEVSMRETPEHAAKDELDAAKEATAKEFKIINDAINAIKLAQSEAAAAQIQAAMLRESNLKDSFRKEGEKIAERMVTKMEALTKDAFQAINAHGERLAKLETISKTWRD